MEINSGVTIERGVVEQAAEGGYKVRSFTRHNIVTPVIPPMPGAAYQVGDRVYFFVFEDGHGLILAAIQD